MGVRVRHCTQLHTDTLILVTGQSDFCRFSKTQLADVASQLADVERFSPRLSALAMAVSAPRGASLPAQRSQELRSPPTLASARHGRRGAPCHPSFVRERADLEPCHGTAEKRGPGWRFLGRSSQQQWPRATVPLANGASRDGDRMAAARELASRDAGSDCACSCVTETHAVGGGELV